MSREDLFNLLKLSDGGLKEIVKRSWKCGSEVKESLKYMERLSFNEALDFLLSHPNVLQTPIIMEEPNYLIGYNEDEIRKFLPKEYRHHQL